LIPLDFLIVEDHPFQRTMLEQVVRSLGARTVHSATNGAEAVRVLRDPARHVDVVISDLMMPDVDGIELLPLLRKSRAGVSLILTSADEAVLLTAAEIARAQGITLLGAIEKPVTAAKLRPLLESHAAGAPPDGGA
jgi:CheY-like chemotaxis protein